MDRDFRKSYSNHDDLRSSRLLVLLLLFNIANQQTPWLSQKYTVLHRPLLQRIRSVQTATVSPLCPCVADRSDDTATQRSL